MNWLNPIAFAGLLAVAVPILVHLFGRRRARRQRFPSLRLLDAARPTPATRSRPSDVLLLLVRCAVIVAAVAALAQPRWTTGDRSREARVPALAILVDTSASMRRLTSGGRSTRDEARETAARLGDSSRTAVIVESRRPGADVEGGASWLSARSGLREVVIISDFQSSALADGDLARVPPDIGLRFIRIDVAGNAPDASPAPPGQGVRVDARLDRTVATWTPSSGSGEPSLRILAGDGEREAVAAALAVATTAGEAVGARRVALVFPGYTPREPLLAALTAPDSAWHGDLLLTLTRDPVLTAVAASALVFPCEKRGVPVARNSAGSAIAQAAGSIRGELVLLSCVDAGSVAGAALVARTAAALAGSPPMGEREPSVLPDELLRRWERPAIEASPRARDQESPDGRWFWLIAIVLLGVEEWLRRRPASLSQAENEVPRARVA